MSSQQQEHASADESDEGPDWKVVAVGGGLGYAIGGPVGGAAGAALAAWIDDAQDSDSAHDQTLATAAHTMRDHASEYGSLYIAHVDPSDVGRELEDDNPQGIVDEMDGDPDILYIDVQGPRANAVVEVETAESLRTQTEHTLDQLERYRATGFKRLLVVPGGDVDAAEEWVENHDDEIEGPLHVTQAAAVDKYF